MIEYSNNQCLKTIAIFGGTFDPIHRGHIQMALEVQAHLMIDDVHFVPCHQPAHRSACVSSQQRLDMLRLALADYPSLTVNDCELRRQGPSYTVDTLQWFRTTYGDNVSLLLLMGADVYASLMQWHRWQCLRQLTHIVVFARPGYHLPQQGPLADYLQTSTPQQLTTKPFGEVVSCDLSLLAISATRIREQLSQGLISDYLLPNVQEYIVKYQLYSIKETS